MKMKLAKSKNNLISKLILIVTLAIVAIVIISSSIFFIYFNQVYKAYQIDYMNLNQKSILARFNELIEQMPKVALQILEEKNVSKIIYYNEISDEKNIAAISTIGTYKFYNNLNSVIIFDSKKDNVFLDNNFQKKTSDEYSKLNPDFKYMLDTYNNGSNFFTVKTTVDGGSDYLTYIYKDYRGTFVIFNFPKSTYFKAHPKDEYSVSFKTWIYYNKKSLIMSDTNNDYDVLDNEYIQDKILRHGGNNLSFSNKGSLYIYSSQGNFSCISSLYYTDMIWEALKTTSIVWSIILVLAAIIFLVSHKRSLKLKETIAKYSKNMSVIETKSENLKFNLAFHKLFNNNELNKEYKTILSDKLSDYQHFKIIVISLDDFESLLYENSYNDISLLKYGICNITEEVLSHIAFCKAIDFSLDNIILILADNAQISTEVLTTNINFIDEVIQQQYDISLTFAISSDISSFEGLLQSAPNIINICEYRFISGYNSIIYQDHINETCTNSLYPFEEQARIINAIDLINKNEFEHAIDDFIELTNVADYRLSKEWILTLFLNISSNLRAKGLQFIQSNTVSELSKSDSLPKSIDLIKNAVYTYAFDESERFDDFDLFVDNIKTLVFDNYSNPNFDINYVAKSLNITPAYAGRKFKMLFNKTFNNYLTEYRIQVAGELLKNTNYKVVQIYELCGFTSSTYFVTVFKKYMLLTPKEYRLLDKHKQ